MDLPRGFVGVFLLMCVIAISIWAGDLTAHPHHPWQMNGRQESQRRVPMRVSSPPGVAPDDQTEPLEAGTVPTIERTVKLKRGTNMRAKGWMSADTHVHNLTPLGAIRQMPVEAIDYVTINDQLPAAVESADYMVARLEATLEWAENVALWSSEQNKHKAVSSFKRAKAFYESAQQRAR